MTFDPALRYSDDECEELFRELFPQGVAGPDVAAALAPEGWPNSPLKAVFHPSPERVYEECLRMHQNIEEFLADRSASQDNAHDPSPDSDRSAPPNLDEIRSEHTDRPVQPERELRELVGMCLWDVFSDNHEVIGPDGRAVDLGSFRASAGFLAEFLNREIGHALRAAEERERRMIEQMIGVADPLEAIKRAAAEREAERAEQPVYDYMDFYCGTQMIAGRADLTPVYRMIFRRLQKAGCDWEYHFPRLLLINMRPLHDPMEKGEPDFANYDPSVALGKEQENSAHDEEIGELRAQMDEAHHEAVKDAQQAPPPKTVAAYCDVYGRLPSGWPPSVEE